MDTAIAAVSTVKIYTGALNALVNGVTQTYTNPASKAFDILEIDGYPTTGASYSLQYNNRINAIYGSDSFPVTIQVTGSSGAINVTITKTATGFTATRITGTGGNVSIRFKYTALS